MSLSRLLDAVQPVRRDVTDHSVYRRLRSMTDLRIFMEHHVFAVWDAACLLHALRREVASAPVPWIPAGPLEARRAVHELFVEDDSCEALDRTWSHFEIYRAAMDTCGADVGPVDRFVDALRGGVGVPAALERSKAPQAVHPFVNASWRIIGSGSAAAISAALTLARHNVLPVGLRSAVARIARGHEAEVELLLAYLERRIDFDEGRQSHVAAALLRSVCGDDFERWSAAERSALESLRSWSALLDGIERSVMDREELVRSGGAR